AAWDLRQFLVSPEVVVDPKDGNLRLAHSVLLADETGATDWRQTEPLSAKVWAKKVFHFDRTKVTSAELFVYGGAGAVRVNGMAIGKSERLISTGWTRLKVPAPFMSNGRNDIVFSGGGSLLLEPSRQPGRSFKSRDAGKTWSNNTLGGKNN